MEVNMSGVENDGGDIAVVDRTLLEKNLNASLDSSDKTTENQRNTISGMQNDKGNNGDDTLTKAERREMKKLLAKKPNASQGSSHQIKLSLKGATLDEILNPQYLQNLEAATVWTLSGTPATNNPTSSKKKKQKNENKNPASGDVKKTCENNKVISSDGSGATKVLEAISGEIDLSKSTIPDATILPKGEHTDVTNSKADSNATTKLNLNDAAEKEAANGEAGSGTTATDTTASKKRKRQKSKKKNLPSGDIMVTGENMQDKIIANEGPGTTKAFGVISGEILSKGEEHTEVINGKTGSSATTNLNLNGIAKEETAIGETATSATTNIIVNSIAEKEGVIVEKGSGTIAMDTTTSKKKKKKRSKKKKLASGDIMITGESTRDKVIADKGLGATKVLEAVRGEMVLGKSEIPDVVILSKGEEHTEVANGETGSTASKKEAANGEAGSGITATDTTASKKRKRQKSKKKNLSSGDIMVTVENMQDKIIANEGPGTTKAFRVIGGEILSKGEEHTEVINGKTGSSATTNLNLNGIAKEETAIGETSTSATTNIIVNSIAEKEGAIVEKGSGTIATDTTTSKKKKKKRSKKKKLASGDIMITGESTRDKVIADKGLGTTKVLEAVSGEMVLGKSEIPDVVMLSKGEEHTEVTNGETGSGTTATDTTSSKKRKKKEMRSSQKKWLNKKKLASGDSMETCESKQDKVVEDKGSDATKVLEAIRDEMISSKSAIPDALSKGKVHTEVTTEKTGISATANLNVKGIAEKEVTDGKTGLIAITNLNVHVIAEKEAAYGETGSGTTATETTASKKRKRQKSKKNKLASSGIMESCENTMDNVIANKDSDTNKPLEALSTDSKREDLPGIDKESSMLKSNGCTDIANSEMGSSGTTTNVENTEVSKKMPWEKKKQKSVGLNTNKYAIVKEITQIATLGKKLIIFDVNGLLADVVSPPPKGIKADKVIPKRAIFKRPFLNDFLCFCFERFNVGIWSSRTEKVLNPVLDFLLGDLKKKLLFYWDASKCTNTGIRTLEDKYKRVVLKDLTNIWEKNGPGNSWMKGTFNESNTLLLDDSPYKALLNPKHTGIFPVSYSYKNKDDDLLGPKGALRIYLEGLAATDSVKTYVEQHPFGQGAIDEKSPNWSFYSRVLKGQNR